MTTNTTITLAQLKHETSYFLDRSEQTLQLSSESKLICINYMEFLEQTRAVALKPYEESGVVPYTEYLNILSDLAKRVSFLTEALAYSNDAKLNSENIGKSFSMIAADMEAREQEMKEQNKAQMEAARRYSNTMISVASFCANNGYVFSKDTDGTITFRSVTAATEATTLRSVTAAIEATSVHHKNKPKEGLEKQEISERQKKNMVNISAMIADLKRVSDASAQDNVFLRAKIANDELIIAGLQRALQNIKEASFKSLIEDAKRHKALNKALFKELLNIATDGLAHNEACTQELPVTEEPNAEPCVVTRGRLMKGTVYPNGNFVTAEKHQQ